MNIVFVHGRSQENKKTDDLTKEWSDAFEMSFKNAGIEYPKALNISFPYYGNDLIKFRDQYKADIKAGKFQMKSPADYNLEDLFATAYIDELFSRTGIPKKTAIDEFEAENISIESSIDKQNRGFLNNRQVLAFIRAIDKYSKRSGNTSIKRHTDDVATYLMVPTVKIQINKIIKDSLKNQPTIVIAHSLGTVIAYEVLRKLDTTYNISAFITLGSPLGVNALQRQLEYPYFWPPCLKGPWINIYDPLDIVALNPLDEKNFRPKKNIDNITVKNKSKNRHNITPYLSSAEIANVIKGIVSDKI